MGFVADTAKEVIDSLSSQMEGVFFAFTLTGEETSGAYNPTTGDYDGVDPAPTATGRCFSGDEKAMADTFPEYVAGPKDVLWYLEGITQIPEEANTIEVTKPSGAETYEITQVGDIVQAGEFFAVIGRLASE